VDILMCSNSVFPRGCTQQNESMPAFGTQRLHPKAKGAGQVDDRQGRC
jgi:hypothetical protein